MSLKGIFFFPASIWRLFLVLLSSKRRCRLCLGPFFSCPPTSTLFVERGPSPPPFPFIGRMGVVDGSRLNFNWKFQFFPAENCSFKYFNWLYFHNSLTQNRSKTIQDGCWFGVFYWKGVFFAVTSCRQRRDSFFKFSSSPLQNGVVPASLLFFLPLLPSRELRAALETWSRGRSSMERWCNPLSFSPPSWNSTPEQMLWGLPVLAAARQEKTFSLAYLL